MPGKDKKKYRIKGLGTNESSKRAHVRPITSGMGTADFFKNPVLLYNHSHEKSIGKVNALPIRGRNMYVDADVYDDTTEGVLVGERAKEGLGGFSPGFLFKLDDLDFPKNGGAPIVYKSEMYEMSAVVLPGNENALISSVEEVE